MANSTEKIFALHFKTTNPLKLHEFIKSCSDVEQGKNKYLHWTRFLDGFYTLATLENTTWNVNNLSKAINKHMEKTCTFVIFEIQDSAAQGRMDGDFWVELKKAKDLTGHYRNLKRARKLKKIVDYTNKKSELERKEQDILRRTEELKKSIDLKKKENELKAQEEELKEMEKQFQEDNNPEIIEPKKRWWKN